LDDVIVLLAPDGPAYIETEDVSGVFACFEKCAETGEAAVLSGETSARFQAPGGIAGELDGDLRRNWIRTFSGNEKSNGGSDYRQRDEDG